MPGIRTFDHGLAHSTSHPVPQPSARACPGETTECAAEPLPPIPSETVSGARIVDWGKDNGREAQAVTVSAIKPVPHDLTCPACGQVFRGVALTLPAACARCGGQLDPSMGPVDSRAEPPPKDPLEALAAAIDEALPKEGEVVAIEAEPTGEVKA